MVPWLVLIVHPTLVPTERRAERAAQSAVQLRKLYAEPVAAYNTVDKAKGVDTHMPHLSVHAAKDKMEADSAEVERVVEELHQ